MIADAAPAQPAEVETTPPAEIAAAPRKGIDPDKARAMAKSVALDAIGTAEEEVDFDSPLMDIGLDSLAAISFREALVDQFGMNLPTSLVFDYPSLNAIADFMVEESKG